MATGTVVEPSPAVFSKLSGAIRARFSTFAAAYAANPTRFRRRRPEPPKLPTVAWINDPSHEVAQKAS